MFVQKYSNIYVDCGNEEKTCANPFRFGDKCIWIGCVEHLFLLRKNISHPVSVS